MRRYLFLFVVVLIGLTMPFQAFAVADMSISASQIWFSTDTLITGQEVRVYATVSNKGDEDISGYVYFYHGATPIGPSQVVSTPAGGENDQVWIDFIVPEGDFNIRAEIKGTSPEDTNTDNDLAITTLYDPIEDTDGDGIEDEQDSCPNVSNPDQQDTDDDGVGNACDSDDDNDSLSDDVEQEIGTDPEDVDSDDDGILDADDDYPTGNNPVVVPDSEPAAISPPPKALVSEIVRDLLSDDTDDEVSDEEDDAKSTEVRPVQTIFLISPNASFIYSPIDWRTYEFRAIAESEDVQLLWEFGDGSTSSQATMQHTFTEPGDYTVTLTAIDSEGNRRVDSQELSISFFHLQNPWIIVLILVLATMVLLFGVLFFKPGTEKKPQGKGKKKKKKLTIKKEHA